MLGKNFIQLFMPVLVPMILAGCGNNSAAPVSALAASQSCIGCHSSAVSPVTGESIVEEWKRSTHNTKNGAACADCHEPDPGHPTSCGKCHNGAAPSGDGHDVTINPVAAGKCEKCHTRSDRLSFVNATTVYRWHFNNVTSATSPLNYKYPASYASAANSAYFNDCRTCHNPHDTSTAISISRQWAKSGHGRVQDNARVAYDFKTRGTYEPVNLTFQLNCVRCHTTTGYIGFVSSGFTVQKPFAGPGYPVVQNLPTTSSTNPNISPDRHKEVTGCNACHDNGQGSAYNFALRGVAPFVAYFNYSSPTKLGQTVKINNSPLYFPDAGTSNICVPCHGGRATGRLITAAAAKFLNFSSIAKLSAHLYVGAATLYKESGYEFDGRSYDNPANFAHDRIGQGNYMNTGTRGPCITCHMNSDRSHSFLPVSLDDPTHRNITAITSRTCSHCHDGSSAIAWTPQDLQNKKAGLAAALAALNALLTRDGLTGTNWAAVPAFPGKKNGANNMGAAFNADLLKNDGGAFAHNDTYVKRLIYDSIDWLNNGVMDNDTETAINSLVSAGKIPSTTGSAAIQYLQGTSVNPSGRGGSRP
jgi:hypothetical protein